MLLFKTYSIVFLLDKVELIYSSAVFSFRKYIYFYNEYKFEYEYKNTYFHVHAILQTWLRTNH